jgi:uncharacterized YccA/Bax inhibitor family protein
MATAVKSAFTRINNEYATDATPRSARAQGSSARGGTAAVPTQAPPVRPTGPSPDEPAPFGGPSGYGPGSYGPNGYGPGNYGPGNYPGAGAPGGYGTPTPTGYGPGGGRGGWGGGGWGGGGGGGRFGGGFGGGVPSAAEVGTRPFSSARAYDKLIVLSIIALVTGIFGYVAVPAGLAFVCIIAAFAVSILTWFHIRWAKVLAPAYAVLEGLALGTISAEYATLGHGIVPVAIVFTAAVFVGALVAYRTGLVRVTPRMVSLAMMGALGLTAVFVLSLLGLSLPGVDSFGTFGLVFGLAMLAIAIVNLFTDFEYVRQSERLAVSSEAEWAAALALMTALVLVYLSILRILASMYGGGGRRG